MLTTREAKGCSPSAGLAARLVPQASAGQEGARGSVTQPPVPAPLASVLADLRERHGTARS